MADRLRFHLDENVNSAIAFGLRLRGIDVTTTTDAGIRSAPDSTQLDYAVATGRVLFSHDSDFLHPIHSERDHFGIVYCAKDARSIGQIIRHLSLLFECLDAGEMQGQVEFC